MSSPTLALAIYIDTWRNFKQKAVHDCFKSMSFKEVKALTPGDTIWYDRDSLSRRGEVCGYVLRKLTRLTSLDENSIRINFKDGSSVLIDEKKGGIKTFCLTNRKKLEALIKEEPRIGHM